jgi:ABC-type multidrug transport system ATPase subunit/pSer/pThr/pTyr-binding forkhead associated (FHA) protein
MGISRHHATIRCDRERVHIKDAGSTYGIRVNGRQIEEIALHQGDILEIGVQRFEVHIDDAHVSLVPSHGAVQQRTHTPRRSTDAPTRITIGRDRGNDVCIEHPMVSRFHAEIVQQQSGGYVLIDNRSTNGTFINGSPVRRHMLGAHDIIQIASMRLAMIDGTLHTLDDCNKVYIHAADVAVALGNRLIVRDISLTIDPGEFVVVLGPSGAGKTTFASALIGETPLYRGEILYNSLPLQHYVSSYASRIGYVAQQNLLYGGLTVYESLWEQAMIRLPADASAAERHARIEWVLRMLKIMPLKDRRVAHLSGGEAKRLHLGIELLSSPTIVFLDEPLAGLDSGLVGTCMEVFRELSRRGHTIILTTHTLEQLHRCDRIVFLSNGTIAYNGRPEHITTHLKVRDVSQAYERARAESTHPVAAVTMRERNKRGAATARASRKEYAVSGAAPSRVRGTSPFVQFAVLVGRYSRLFLRDRKNAAVVCVQAPLIAFLLMCVFTREAYVLPLSFYFCVTISAIWLGSVNGVREVAAEWKYLRRDIRGGLYVPVYCTAKLVLATGLGLVQALLLHGSLWLLLSSYTFDVATCGVIAAAAAAGAVLGLCVSALSASVRQAISWLPVVLIPQIFFSGILASFDDMHVVGRLLSRLMISRPVFSILKRMHLAQDAGSALHQWYYLGGVTVGLSILLYISVFLRMRKGRVGNE